MFYATQVLKLLDSMDMSQYRQVFQREQVSGAVLCMVDDQMLREDLMVSSKIHRVRLLKVVTGQVSVASLRESKYGRFVK